MQGNPGEEGDIGPGVSSQIFTFFFVSVTKICKLVFLSVFCSWLSGCFIIQLKEDFGEHV